MFAQTGDTWEGGPRETVLFLSDLLTHSLRSPSQESTGELRAEPVETYLEDTSETRTESSLALGSVRGLDRVTTPDKYPGGTRASFDGNPNVPRHIINL